MNNVVPFSKLFSAAPDWYRAYCMPHVPDELTRLEQMVLMALEFGMPPGMDGDADGVCFVADNSEFMPEFGTPDMVGTGPVRVLRVTENLDCYISVVGTGKENSVTLLELQSNWSLLPCNPAAIEGWLG